MKKSEIFDIIVDKVCEVCEVRRSQIINLSKLQAVVDARIIAVQYLHRIGLSHEDIALIALREEKGDKDYFPPFEAIRRRAKSIDKMYYAYEQRIRESYAFNLMSLEVKEYCRERYSEYHIKGMKCLPD